MSLIEPVYKKFFIDGQEFNKWGKLISVQDFDPNANFDKADIEIARIRTDAGKPCTADDDTLWREEHKYTWHQEADCKSMKKVPLVIHGNMSHNGGISKK